MLIRQLWHSIKGIHRLLFTITSGALQIINGTQFFNGIIEFQVSPLDTRTKSSPINKVDKVSGSLVGINYTLCNILHHSFTKICTNYNHWVSLCCTFSFVGIWWGTFPFSFVMFIFFIFTDFFAFFVYFLFFIIRPFPLYACRLHIGSWLPEKVVIWILFSFCLMVV